MRHLVLGRSLSAVGNIIATLLVISLVFGPTLPARTASADGETPITECGTIDEPGEYIIATSTLSSVGTCLTIATSSVTILGDGASLIGDGDEGDYGITALSVSNISISNLTIQDFDRGIFFATTSSSTIEEVTATSSSRYGMVIEDSSAITIASSTVSGTEAMTEFEGIGILLVSTTGSTITGNGLSSNPMFGIVSMGTSTGNVITNNAVASGVGGIYVSSCIFFDDDCGESSSNVLVEGNVVIGSEYAAIAVIDLTDSSIVGNEVSSSTDGIIVDGESSGLLIEDNIITNVEGTGIYLDATSTDMTIRENSINSYGEGDADLFGERGIYLEATASTTVATNTIRGFEYGIYADEEDDEGFSDLTIEDNSVTDILRNGMHIQYGEDLSIINNDIARTGLEGGDSDYSGIYIDDMTGTVRVEDNDVVDSYAYGIFVDDGNDLILTGNTVTGVTEFDGLNLNGFNEMTVSGNIISSTTGDGIDVDDSTNVTISENQVSNVGAQGIEVEDSSDVLISGNTVEDIEEDGILLDAVFGFDIVENTVSSEENGIFVEGFSAGDLEGELVFPGAHSGEYVWSSQYGNNIESMLSHTFDLSEATNATTSVWLWALTEPDYDYLYFIAESEATSTSVFSLSGDYSEWTEYEFDLSDFVGGEVTFTFLYETDGSVVLQGAYLDDFSLVVDGEEVWTDDVEEDNDEWTVEGSGPRSWTRSSDGTVSEATVENTIMDNVVTTLESATSSALYLDEVSTVTILNNTFRAPRWVEVGTSTDSEYLVFNDSDSGNTYLLPSGEGAWTLFDIRDSNGDGWADNGSDLPFSMATLGEEYWNGPGADAHPATETRGTGRKPGGSYVSRTTPAVSSDTTPSDTITKLITDNRALFLQAHSLGITLPVFILQLLGLAPTDGVRDLELNMEGADVTKLQQILITAATGPQAAALKANGTSTFFGPLTQAALAEYQKAHNIVPAIGYFGPLTRAQMKQAGVGGVWW